MHVLRRVLPRFVLALLVLGPGATPLLLGQTASLVADLRTELDADAQIPHDLGTSGENALFQIFEFPSLRSQMWVSDGTASGTRPLLDIGEHRALFLGTIGRVTFWASGLDLWRSDGTQEGTFRLRGPGDLQLAGGFDPTGSLFAFAGGFLYFAGCTDDLGCEIWRTDGTQEGTRIVQDLTPERDGSPIREIGAVGDRVFVLLESELRAVEAQGTRLLLSFQQRGVDLWAAARGRLFFLVGNAIWATDGTPAGTRRLMESSVPDSAWPMTAAPGGLYFMANESGRAREIWRSDGTPGGTRRLTEPLTNVGLEPYHHFAAEIGDSLLFLAFGDGYGWRLWRLSVKSGSLAPVGDALVRSELFQAGGRVLFALKSAEGCDLASVDAQGKITRLVKGLSCVTFIPSNFVPSVISKGYFYFSGYTSSALQIWRSDGTPAGTDLLLSVPRSEAFRDIAVSATGRRVFVTVDSGLWLWEQSSGARQLMGPGPRTESADLSELIPIGKRLFFSVCTSEQNLWMSTGTAASTVPLTSFSGEFCHGDLTPLASGTSLFFLDPTHQELWKTDAAGSAPVLLVRNLGQMSSLAAHQGRAWFVVRAGAHSEIWTSDGTPAGTHVAAVLPGDTLILTPLFSAGGLLYFTARSILDGQELTEVWRSDGTAAGTIRLADTHGHFARDFVRLGSFVYFLSFQGLWRTDGTPAGTVPLSEAGVEIDSPSDLTAHEDSFYLFGRRDLLDARLTLWRTNGTPEDTLPVATFPLELFSNEVRPTLVPFQGRLFFAVDDGIHGTELWATDGTSAGTVLVSDLAPGPEPSSPEHMIVAGNVLYFSAHDRAHGRELWRTDGTAAGTRRVQDIAPESLSSSPEHLTVAGDHLYFVADDGLTGRELWKLPLQSPGCQPSSTRLCLNDGRFQVEVIWRDFQGRRGQGMASSLTDDTGWFWFFDPANVEVVLKVLDGRGLNDHHWVFYGALSSVEYAITVTDIQTGLARRYLNPAGQLASVGDTHGFGPLGAHSATPDFLVALPSPPALVSARTVPAAATGTCQAGPQRLCLNGGRFAVEASWKDFQGHAGKGAAVPLTGDTGWFWFFDSSNVEVMIKVLDGAPVNGRFWVFYGALSNVEYTLTVTDTQTGAVKEYRNPAGRFASVADTAAF